MTQNARLLITISLSVLILTSCFTTGEQPSLEDEHFISEKSGWRSSFTIRKKDPESMEVWTSELNAIWQKPINAKDIDFLQFIGDNRLLVGTVDMRTAFWKPVFAMLYLIDLQTGEEIWSLSREDYFNDNQSILLSGDAVLIKGMSRNETRTRYYSIDLQTGQELWSHEIKNILSFAILNHGMNELVVVSGDAEDSLTVEGLNLTDTSQNWKASIPGFEFQRKEPLKLKIVGTDLLIAGSGIANFSLAIHEPVWYKETIEESAGELSFLFFNNRMICYEPQNVFEMDIETGEALWSTKKDNPIEHAAFIKDNLYLVQKRLGEKSNNFIVEKVDVHTGQVVWITELEERILSSLILDEENLYFSTPSVVCRVDDSSGNIQTKYLIPEVLRSENYLVDRILFRDEDLVVARENGIAVFEQESGILRFAHYIAGVRSFTSAYVLNKIQLQVIAAAQQRKGKTSTAEPGDVREMMAAVQKRHAQEVVAMNTAAFGRYNAIQWNVLQAHDALHSGASAWDFASGSTQLVSMSIGLGSAIGTAIMSQMKQKSISTLLDRYSLLSDGVINAFNNSTGEDFFVRPFYNDGWYIAVIDFRNGRRADLLVLEDSEVHAINGANLPTFVVDSDRGILIFRTYQSDTFAPRHYKQKTMKSDADALFSSASELQYPYLTAVDITKLDFSDCRDSIEGYATRQIGGREKELIDALRRRDTDKAKTLILAGADVNVRDEYGLTPAMYASVTIDTVRFSRFLESNGADFSITDDHGWAPWHYAFFHHVEAKTMKLAGSYYIQHRKRN